MHTVNLLKVWQCLSLMRLYGCCVYPWSNAAIKNWNVLSYSKVSKVYRTFRELIGSWENYYCPESAKRYLTSPNMLICNFMLLLVILFINVCKLKPLFSTHKWLKLTCNDINHLFFQLIIKNTYEQKTVRTVLSQQLYGTYFIPHWHTYYVHLQCSFNPPHIQLLCYIPTSLSLILGSITAGDHSFLYSSLTPCSHFFLSQLLKNTPFVCLPFTDLSLTSSSMLP